MGLETGTYLSDLVPANPAGTDPKSQGDNHIRLLKSVLQNTFPNLNGAVNATPAELNRLVGIATIVQSLLAAADAAAVRALLDLEPGTDVQAYDADTAKLDLAQTWTAVQTLAGIISTKGIRETTFSGNAGTAFTVNFSTHGTVIALTLNQANCDLTFPTPTDGDQFTLMLTLGAAGRTYAFPGMVRWDADGAPDPSTLSGRTDTYTFQGRSGFWLARGAGNGFVLS